MALIRICIADDHKLFRKLTKSYLDAVPRIDSAILEADNGKDLLRVMRNHPVDVALLDISMPIMSGDEAARTILRRYPQTKIVMLTIDDTPEKILELMNMGVHGYLLKDCDPEEVVRAIEAVVDRDFYKNEVAERALNQVESRYVKKTGRDRLLEELTKREKEILKHICDEFTTKEIGVRLSIWGQL
ncbi:MAG: response regulator transcription factor, partial [Cyclobacteriaceae bacterium]